MSYIQFNGKRSDEFHLQLESGLSFSSPSVNVDMTKIAGRDGEIAISDGTFNNTQRAFPFELDLPKNKTVEEVSTEISDWLKNDTKWHDLFFAGDPEYIYQAMYHEEYEVNRFLSWYGRCVLKFTIKPYKFLKSGLNEISFPSVLRNPTNRAARPRITIQGTGNITIRIGSETLTLRAVDEGIIIDTLNQTVTTLDGKRPAWDKVTSYPLPVIKPGRHNVTITGTVTSREIIPRWEVIV